ncbi:unnamed protein product [Arabidopsis halleri]
MKLTASQRQTEGDEDVQSNTITQLEIDAIMLEVSYIFVNVHSHVCF